MRNYCLCKLMKMRNLFVISLSLIYNPFPPLPPLSFLLSTSSSPLPLFSLRPLLSSFPLSGAGASRRLPSDLPPHIQQLLDQQELQSFERSSPSRRPVYRKLLIGGPSAPSKCLGPWWAARLSIMCQSGSVFLIRIKELFRPFSPCL